MGNSFTCQLPHGTNPSHAISPHKGIYEGIKEKLSPSQKNQTLTLIKYFKKHYSQNISEKAPKQYIEILFN